MHKVTPYISPRPAVTEAPLTWALITGMVTEPTKSSSKISFEIRIPERHLKMRRDEESWSWSGGR